MPLNRSGFTLIEMMVTLGVSAVVTVATTTAFVAAQRNVLDAAAKSNGQGLAKEISQATNLPQGCADVLKNQAFTPDVNGRLDLNLNLGGRSIAAGYVSQTDGIRLTDLYLGNVRALNMVGSNNKPVYEGDIYANLQPIAPHAIARRVTRVGRLYLEVNGPTIMTCASNKIMPDILQASCLQMGGLFANGACNMAPYVNGVIAETRKQVDTELYGPYNKRLTTQIYADVAQAMKDVLSQGAAATTAYTQAAMTRVGGNLTQNLNQVNGAQAALQQNINTTITQATAGKNDARARADAVYQAASTSYVLAINEYNLAAQAASTAQSTAANVNSGANIAGNSLSFGLNAQNTSYAISSVAYQAMNSATQAVTLANASNAAATNASGVAANASAYANAAADSAKGSLGYAQGANGSATNASAYAAGAQATANAAVSYAQSAANNASYAAGVASNAANYANYAYNNPATINTNYITIKTYLPVAPAAPAAYWARQDPLWWSPRDAVVYVPYDQCPGNASPGGGQCGSVNRYCAVIKNGRIADMWYCYPQSDALYYCQTMIRGYHSWPGCASVPGV